MNYLDFLPIRFDFIEMLKLVPIPIILFLNGTRVFYDGCYCYFAGPINTNNLH